MKTYKSIPLEKAYELLNTGAIILVGSENNAKIPNLTPIAWNTLVDYEPVTRLLFVCDKEHLTYENISDTMHFVVILPHASQSEMVKQLGSVSGRKENKIEKFSIPLFLSDKYKIPVLSNCIAYLECKVYRILDESAVAIIFGEVENAQVDTEAFTDRLLSETEAGKTLHHLGGKKFLQPGDEIL
jgi:flavin reductase (DIM6/NTAB) family NADH-FMN oxidoreductase RutF